MTVSSLVAFLILGFCAENTLSLEGKKLTLNGSGIYTATLFAVKVYEQSLYLERPSHDGEAIKASNQMKVFRMRFLRELPEDRFRDGWVTNHLKRCHDLPCLKAGADLPTQINNENFVRSFIGTVVADHWEGVRSGEQEVPFSEDNFVMVMTEIAPSLWEELVNFVLAEQQAHDDRMADASGKS
jgi:hypothetical protein